MTSAPPSAPRRGRVARALRVVLAVAVLAAVGGLVAREQSTRDDTTVVAYFTESVGLYPGSDVRMLGVPVGTVTAVDAEGSRVKVSMTIDPEFSAASDTGAVIVAPSLVSDRYVQLSEPWDGGERLRSGDEIGLDRTAVPVELDQLYQSLDDVSVALGPDGANADGALSRLVGTGADNLDGLGSELNRMFADFGDFTGTLADSDDQLFATVTNFEEFNDMLVANDAQVSKVNRQFAAVTDYLAADREDLAAAVDSLGSALGRVDGFIRDNRARLRSSVKGLTGTAQVLARQRDSLAEMLRVAPLALRNFLDTYDQGTGVLRGRVNLNEVSIWARATGQVDDPTAPSTPSTPSSSTDPTDDPLTPRTSSQAPPPLLLPGLEADR